MKAQLTLLAELQAVDSRLKSMEAGRDTLFVKQRLVQVEVDKLRGEFKTQSTRLEELEKEKRQKEGELSTEKDKLRKWESRLEDLRNSREFAALSREVEGLKRNITDLQERTGTLNTDIGEATAKLREVAGRLGDVEKTLADETKGANHAANKQESGLQAERENRKRLAAQLPANVMKRYDQIFTKRGGVAVVVARDGCCSGCNMKLPPQTYIKVQRGETLEHCAACNRMLYFPDNLARDVMAPQV